MKTDPKIILFDIESTNLSDAFGSILCIAYKELGEKETHCIKAWDDKPRWKKAFYDDSYVLKEFRKVLKDADKVIYHFGMWFDQPMINSRLARMQIRNKAGKIDFIPPDIQRVDTYILAKRNLKLDRRRLDNIAEALGCKQRKKHIGSEIWKKVMNREPKAQNLMESYNKQDVNTLEAVYKELAIFDNKTLFPKTDYPNCPSCGAKDVSKNGTLIRRAGRFQRYICGSCASIFKGEKLIS